jgi:hypothetical protein
LSQVQVPQWRGSHWCCLHWAVTTFIVVMGWDDHIAGLFVYRFMVLQLLGQTMSKSLLEAGGSHIVPASGPTQ